MNLWGQETTLRGQILVSRTGDDPLFPLPLPPPCVHSKRPLVYVRNVPVCTGTTPACVITCGRGAGTHGDVLNSTHGGVLNVHTEVFLNVHTGTPHTPHNTDRETQRQRQTDTERDRVRQRETERDRERDTKQDKKKKEKKREDEKGETRR